MWLWISLNGMCLHLCPDICDCNSISVENMLELFLLIGCNGMEVWSLDVILISVLYQRSMSNGCLLLLLYLRRFVQPVLELRVVATSQTTHCRLLFP